MSTGAARTDFVVPVGGQREALWVALVTAVVVVGMVALARLNAQHVEKFEFADWQVSAFDDLNATDQAIYNALLIAAETLWVDYEYVKRWSRIEDLESPDYGLAPFARDVSWRQRGEVQWQLIKTFSFDGATVYCGRNGKVSGQSAYLLILSHAHKGASFANQSIVWLHPDARVAPPDTVTRDSLIRNGWREIVPYRGDREVRRLGRK